MISQIQLSYPFGYLLLCVLVGLCFALLMYWRENKFVGVAKGWKYLLFLTRLLTGFLISALLLNPFIKTVKEDVKKPIIVYAQDNSKSIELAESNMSDFFEGRNTLLTDLEKDYELVNLRFGSEVDHSTVDSFQSKSTNLSALISYVSENYGDQNLGALILASDGLYNEGVNPVYQNAAMKAAIYPIALGDSTIRRDVLIKNVFHNRIAYLGDRFDIQVDIQGLRAAGSQLTVTLSEVSAGKSTILDTKPLTIDKNDFFKTIDFEVEAKRAGTVEYEVKVSGIRDEISSRNNRKRIFVEVLDSRQNLLLLAHAPHPDITALKQIIELNKNYSLDIKYAHEGGIAVRDYDMTILHSLPSAAYPIKDLIRSMQKAGKPSLFIVGSKTDVAGLNEVQDAMQINARGNTLNESQASYANKFSNFIVSDEAVNFLEKVPPLTTFFGEHKAGANAKPILYQKIKDIETEDPLLLIQDRSNVKTGILAGEGIWRWRLYDFLQSKNHQLADELLIKLIQYLSTKEDKRKFRSFVAKNIFKENESIRIDAQLYNDNYELINDPEVSAVVRQGSKEFNFTFSRSQNAYTLDIGRLPPGRYAYQAKTNNAGVVLESGGNFTVQNIELEQYDLTAKHDLLYTLAATSNGKVFSKENIQALTNEIRSNSHIKPVAYYSNQTRNIIHYKWIWGLLIFLLALEWFLRRYLGSY